MSDKNTFTEGKIRKPGTNRIKTMKILDLTDGKDSKVGVTLTSRRQITQVDDESEARQLKEDAIKSPWRDDRSKAVYANKSMSTRRLKDPIKELKLFTQTMTRG